jgi:hypothetical protein
MLMALPCNDLYIHNDPSTSSRYLVSTPAFFSEHEVRVRVRLGWMKDTACPPVGLAVASNATVVSLAEYRSLHPRFSDVKFDGLITSGNELYAFLRQRLDALEPTKLYSAETVERALRWADRPLRNHPQWGRLRSRASSSAATHSSKGRQSRLQQTQRLEENIPCNPKLIKYSGILRNMYRFHDPRYPITHCCHLLADVLRMLDNGYLDTIFEDGYCYIIGTRKLERKYEVRVRVRFVKLLVS